MKVYRIYECLDCGWQQTSPMTECNICGSTAIISYLVFPPNDNSEGMYG